MESSVRESERLQIELQELTLSVRERRGENEKLTQENLTLRDELRDKKQLCDRYLKYIGYVSLPFSNSHFSSLL